MVGASVGQPGRQTGGLSMHPELSTDRTLREGCSGSQPASQPHMHPIHGAVDMEQAVYRKGLYSRARWAL